MILLILKTFVPPNMYKAKSSDDEIFFGNFAPLWNHCVADVVYTSSTPTGFLLEVVS